MLPQQASRGVTKTRGKAFWGGKISRRPSYDKYISLVLLLTNLENPLILFLGLSLTGLE